MHIVKQRPEWEFVLYGETPETPQSLEGLLTFANVRCTLVDTYDADAVDLLHICDPMNTLLGFDSPFRVFPHPVLTTTFYDLIPLTFYFPYMHELYQSAYKQRLSQMRARGAVALAISEHTKRDMIKYGVLPPDRIEVIMAGLNCSAEGAQGDPGAAEVVKKRLGISKPFFLHVGALDPHKNFETTLKAFSACSKEKACQLVVVGKMEDYIKAYADHVKLKGIKGVIFAGFLQRQELEALYTEARALVMMSHYEGFGFPVLEAMAHGCPVISSNTSSIPEVAGDAAILLPPSDVQGVTRAMRMMLTNAEKREELQRRGIARARLFTWEETANRTLRVWEKLLQTEPNRISFSEHVQVPSITSFPNTSQKKSLPVVWQGDVFVTSSLALVNREVVTKLLERGVNVVVKSVSGIVNSSRRNSKAEALGRVLNRTVQGEVVHVRHFWPPDFSAPASGHLVVMQPWEFGSLPQDWVRAIYAQVDEVWVYTSYLKQVYIDSGVPASRIHVIPLGIDPHIFNPDAPPRKLKTRKKFRFLFVGGTIFRKGIDLLLRAYTQEFTPEENVCLVIKEMGAKTFYKGQTAQQQIRNLQADPKAPEIEYIEDELTENEMAGLYVACDVLVHPYRGEGFGLPVLESLACARPAVVTNGGACLDFCNEENSILVAARPKRFAEKRVGEFETVDYPWLFEVDETALRTAMRFAFEHPAEMKTKGQTASTHVRTYWTWERTAECVLQRLQQLNMRPILRTSVTLLLGELAEALSDINRLVQSQQYQRALFRLDVLGETLGSRLPSDEFKPLRAEMECLKGDCYLRLNEFDKAKACYEGALQACPNSSRACVGLGAVFFMTGFDEHAKTMFEWGVTYDAKNEQAVRGLAVVNEKLELPSDHNRLLAMAAAPVDLDRCLSAAMIDAGNQ